MSEGFQGLEGQLMPDMNVDMVNQISSRYQELYRAMTGAALKERSYEDIFTNMQESIELGITKLT
jgi:phosphoribosylaminoimidazole-succinocarboxamide synthase